MYIQNIQKQKFKMVFLCVAVRFSEKKLIKILGCLKAENRNIHLNTITRDEDHVIKMAYNFRYFGGLFRANIIPDRYIENKQDHKKRYICWLKLNYPSPVANTDLGISELMEASQILTPCEWLSLFSGPFCISRQYFDYEPLPQLYCKMQTMCND